MRYIRKIAFILALAALAASLSGCFIFVPSGSSNGGSNGGGSYGGGNGGNSYGGNNGGGSYGGGSSGGSNGGSGGNGGGILGGGTIPPAGGDPDPILLTSLDYTQKARYISVGAGITSYAKCVNEYVYDSENVLRPSGGTLNSEHAETEDDAYIIYYLNGKYSTLDGVLYRPYCTLSWSDEFPQSTVRIYGDGRLIYEAPAITKNTYDPIPFSVNVSGVSELKIVMLGVHQTKTDFVGAYSFDPVVCMADAYLK